MSKKSTNPQINVTPLIDVLLVLLITFMVLTPMSPHKFDSQIPQQPTEEQQPLAPSPDLLVVTLDRNRNISLNTEPLTMGELGVRLQKVLSERSTDQRKLFIRAAKDLNYGAVIEVIDTVKMAGAAPIGLQIDLLDNI